MASKTYLPTLIRLLYRVCVYIVRWRRGLDENLTLTQQGLLDAVVEACEAFTQAVELPEGV